jgi:hypothetical protein
MMLLEPMLSLIHELKIIYKHPAKKKGKAIPVTGRAGP